MTSPATELGRRVPCQAGGVHDRYRRAQAVAARRAGLCRAPQRPCHGRSCPGHCRASGPALLRAGPDGPVAGYMPIRTEIDPLPAMTSAGRAGDMRLCVPVIRRRRTSRFDFDAWTPDCCTMVAGPFGAPGAGETGKRLVPRAADRPARRLRPDGKPAGLWRRVLRPQRWKGCAPHGTAVCAIGLAYGRAGTAGDLPHDATDRQLDAIVTEAGVIRPA
jgi:5-formyltetrahydrofolate cyclo-ligase